MVEVLIVKPELEERMNSSFSSREVFRPCFLVQCFEMMNSSS
jgi:hypothetical protein